MIATIDTGRPPVRVLLEAGELDVPLPGSGATPTRWAALARWGARDAATARLAEGHVDAVAILAEAGRRPERDTLYGVWASRSGGGPRLLDAGDGRRLDGTMRFCSGARTIDRALVVADGLLVDVPVTGPEVVADPSSWATAAMAGADTLDVRFSHLPVTAVLGGPDWYTTRTGFAAGGAGVAAVWSGAASGLLDSVAGHLGDTPDAHGLAHLGELHGRLAAADALLDRVADAIDAGAEHAVLVATVRSAVEGAVRDVLDRVPRMVGPGPLSRDAGLAGALADLALYVRQHHGERDHAALGAQVLPVRSGR